MTIQTDSTLTEYSLQKTAANFIKFLTLGEAKREREQIELSGFFF